MSFIPVEEACKTLLTAQEALERMKEARQEFVQRQYDELWEKIETRVEKSCEEYRNEGKSKGVNICIDMNTLAPENKKALQDAGYTLESVEMDCQECELVNCDGEECQCQVAWIRVNIPENKSDD